jgi:hypothetical protein
MSTSGTITFTQTRDQIISDALSLLGVLAAGETATTADISLCSNYLNKMVKAWMGQGIHLWTEESGTIFLVQNQAQYNIIAGASGANASDGTGTPVETTLSSIANSGSTSITVTTSTGMSNGDVIGIAQSNQVIYWTTIASISGNTVNLVGTTTYSAASGNAVFTYTTQLPRALSIQSARLRNNQGFDKMMEIKPREDYMRIPQKQLSGDPIILYYSPQVTTGQVFVWPVPSDVNKRLEITYLREIQDFDSSSDNADFPQEWLEAITFNLAVRIAPAYGINLSSGGYQGNPDILVQAASYLDAMKAWDSEQPYIQIVPKTQYYPR